MEFLSNFFETANIGIVVALFVVGLIFIIKGGDWFVDSASWIAEVLGVPKFIIGATIVSVATTLPEMIVSIVATVDGKVDMASGNAVGSVTANTAMIMGIFIVCMPFAVKRKEFAPKGLMMLAAAVALTLGSGLTGIVEVPGLEGKYHTLSTVGVIVLFAIFIAFFIENFISMKKVRFRLSRTLTVSVCRKRTMLFLQSQPQQQVTGLKILLCSFWARFALL